MIESRIDRIRREQLDRKLAVVRDHIAAFQRPGDGWVSALRMALGMTQAQLAARLQMTQQGVQQLEKRERDGGSTLSALEEVAGALDATLVYALVPRRPLGETLEARARRLAVEMIQSVDHTMALEAQRVDADTEARVQELTRELLAAPRRLWSVPDEG